MIERRIEIETADGAMPVFVTHPEDESPFAPVVVYMDVWGVREQLYDIARRIATVGYVGVVPNLYYREGGGSFGNFRHPDGRTRSLKDLDAAERDKILAYHSHLTDLMAIADTGAMIKFFNADAAVRIGPAGSVGYCMGGRHVLCAATAFPDTFIASASLHPTRLVGDDKASPHRAVGAVRGEFYAGFGERDHYTPPEVITAVREAFAAAEAHYEDIVHADTDHGYAIPDRDVFSKHAAARDWERIFPMYRRQLGVGADAPAGS
jgi:carboxymethylenebutenolidase